MSENGRHLGEFPTSDNSCDDNPVLFMTAAWSDEPIMAELRTKGARTDGHMGEHSMCSKGCAKVVSFASTVNVKLFRSNISIKDGKQGEVGFGKEELKDDTVRNAVYRKARHRR